MHVNKSTCDRLAPSRFLNILFCCIVILYNHWFLTSVLSSRNTRFSAGENKRCVIGRELGGGERIALRIILYLISIRRALSQYPFLEAVQNVGREVVVLHFSLARSPRTISFILLLFSPLNFSSDNHLIIRLSLLVQSL